MALTGNFGIKGWMPTGNKIQETDPDTGETREVDELDWQVVDTIENCYIKIPSVHPWQQADNTYKIDINYFIYQSKEDADNGDLEDNLLFNELVPLVDITADERLGNIFELAYNKVKELPEFENLSDA